jgi:hypothetical protein
MIERALIVRNPWAELEVIGVKTWELRSRATKFRGEFAIALQGTGMLIGQATLVDVIENLTLSQLISNYDKHHVKDEDLLKKWCYPWVLENAIKYEQPIPYNHPQGAVTWVKLKD